MVRILIADDEPNVSSTVQHVLNKADFSDSAIAATGEEALAQLNTSSFEIALLDLCMPPPDGLDILKQIHQSGIQIDVVMFSGFGTIKEAVEAMKLGAHDFLEKPINFTVLIDLVRRIAQQREPALHPLARRLDYYLGEHATDPGMCLDTLCQHFHISSSYAAKLFRQHIGMRFRDRLTHYRMEKAKQLIRFTDKPFWTIAAQCGFKHQSRLSTVFKRVTGETPGKFKKVCR